MYVLRFICSLLAVGALFAGCKKELSYEKVTDEDPSGGKDCSVAAVIPVDSLSGRGYGSFYVSTGANNQANGIVWYDSTSGTVSFQAAFSYSHDTMRVNENEFFVLDDSGRVVEFNTLEDPSDKDTEPYRYTYQYDTDGQLYSKSWFLPEKSADIPLFTFRYEWAGGNLTGLKVNEGYGNKRLALSAEIRYYTSIPAKNFLYFLPDSYELAPYIFSVNMGMKSKNLPEKIMVTVYDSDGNAIHTYKTVYSGYKFSVDHYVTELHVDGDTVDGLPLVNGYTKFEYQCK